MVREQNRVGQKWKFPQQYSLIVGTIKVIRDERNEKSAGRVMEIGKSEAEIQTRVCLTPKSLLPLLHSTSVPLLECHILFHSQK